MKKINIAVSYLEYDGLDELIEEDRQLLEKARGAIKSAYAPYSAYHVGAAVLLENGKVVTGNNQENVAYPSGTCAERVAVFKAVSEGEKEFEAIVVASSNGGTPCGACRQVLSEFGLDTKILIVDSDGVLVLETTVNELLPGAFTPEDLPPQ
jgi:cytidine deaminase